MESISAHVHSYLEITYYELCLIYTDEFPYLDALFEDLEGRQLLKENP